MTAFSRHTAALPGGSGTWELRSVNHRYLDVQFRLSDVARPHEAALRAVLQQKLQRGRVEVAFSFSADVARARELDATALASLRGLSKQLAEAFPAARPLSQAEILAFPDVLAAAKTDETALGEALLASFRLEVDELLARRAAEGERIQQMLAKRVSAIREQVSVVRAEKPVWEAELAARWQEKLAEFGAALEGGELDKQRLHQEMAVLLTKTDVAEELDRLLAHCDEVEIILNEAGKAACGRRLDFMMQELNREANTLGSKSYNQALTQAAVELKVLIDQMREQIQNVE